MDNPMMSEGSWFWRLSQLTTLMEWLQPLLYCLLALVLICFLLTLIDLALLCWKEFHLPQPQQTAVKPRAATFKAGAECEVLAVNDVGDKVNAMP